jgi:peptidyl-prolyl cis-trans isomerase B (cyclophilin B)
MEPSFNEQQLLRRQSLDELRALGIDPYPAELFPVNTTADEIKNEADNGLANDIYTIAMARTSAPHSASNQFFINVGNNDFLNYTAPNSSGWGYCVFGKVTAGMDVVDKIKKVATTSRNGHQDVPVENVIIESATRC